MTRGSRGNELVGDFSAEGAEEIEVSHKERQVRVIGHGIERIHFQRKMAPVLEKLAHHGQRQLAFAQLRHEGAFIDFVVRVFIKRRVEIIDVGLGFVFAQLFAGLGFFGLAHGTSCRINLLAADFLWVIIGLFSSQGKLPIWKYICGALRSVDGNPTE